MLLISIAVRQVKGLAHTFLQKWVRCLFTVPLMTEGFLLQGFTGLVGRAAPVAGRLSEAV